MRSALGLVIASALLIGGCSLVFDGSKHTSGGGGEQDAATDQCTSHSDCSSEQPYCAVRATGRTCIERCEYHSDCDGFFTGDTCIDGFCGCTSDFDCPDPTFSVCGDFDFCTVP